jgi:hypothetical protein
MGPEDRAPESDEILRLQAEEAEREALLTWWAEQEALVQDWKAATSSDS